VLNHATNHTQSRWQTFKMRTSIKFLGIFLTLIFFGCEKPIKEFQIDTNNKKETAKFYSDSTYTLETDEIKYSGNWIGGFNEGDTITISPTMYGYNIMTATPTESFKIINGKLTRIKINRQKTDKDLSNNYEATTIELNIEDEPSLMILLHKDGTINRKGRGTEEIDNNFYMGIQYDSLLSELTKSITTDFQSLLNKVNDYPDKKGKTCMLEITLSDGKETKGVRYTYGSESMGPPIPIANYVNKAIELTDPWYNEQVKMVENSKTE
jgi:hypothetical protein